MQEDVLDEWYLFYEGSLEEIGALCDPRYVDTPEEAIYSLKRIEEEVTKTINWIKENTKEPSEQEWEYDPK